MTSTGSSVDLALIVFRIAIGGMIFTHGVSHIGLRREKIDGTAAWFGSMGMRPARLHAWLASVTEIAAGALLVLGLATPLGAAALLGVMTVAFTIAHRDKGFFIYNPGQGWEYVAVLGACAVALGTVGPGRWSIDHAADTGERLGVDLVGTSGLLLTVVPGVGGAIVLLAVCWRRPGR